jgi:hypothetical protein
VAIPGSGRLAWRFGMVALSAFRILTVWLLWSPTPNTQGGITTSKPTRGQQWWSRENLGCHRPGRLTRSARRHLEQRRRNLPGLNKEQEWAGDRPLHSGAADERTRATGATRGKVRTTTTTTTIADPAAARPADLVQRRLRPPAPNRLWVADLTYVSTFWVCLRGLGRRCLRAADPGLAGRLHDSHVDGARHDRAGHLEPTARRCP